MTASEFIVVDVALVSKSKDPKANSESLSQLVPSCPRVLKSQQIIALCGVPRTAEDTITATFTGKHGGDDIEDTVRKLRLGL